MTKKATTADLLDKMENQVEEAKDLMNTTTTAVDVSRPAPRGFEAGHDQDDLLMPRAKMLQALSPECQEGGDGMPGAIINSLTGEELPKRFIPLFHFKEYAKFNPRNKNDRNFDSGYEPAALIWKTNDHNDPRVAETKFGADGTLPTAIEFFNFLALFEGQNMPIVVSFSKTSHKTGKKLFTLAYEASFSGADMFGRKYELTTRETSNESGPYYVLQVAPAGKVEGDEFAKAEQLHTMMHHRKSDIATDMSGETGD